MAKSKYQEALDYLCERRSVVWCGKIQNELVYRIVNQGKCVETIGSDFLSTVDRHMELLESMSYMQADGKQLTLSELE